MRPWLSYIFWGLLVAIVVVGAKEIPHSGVNPGYFTISVSYNGGAGGAGGARCYHIPNAFVGRIAGCLLHGSGWAGVKLTSVK